MPQGEMEPVLTNMYSVVAVWHLNVFVIPLMIADDSLRGYVLDLKTDFREYHTKDGMPTRVEELFDEFLQVYTKSKAADSQQNETQVAVNQQ